MNNRISSNFLIYFLFFFIGLLVGENYRGKGFFFTSWYGNVLSYGEEVRVKKSDEGYDFYNPCKKMTIVGLQAVDNANEAWVLLEDCGFDSKYMLETFNQNSLEKI